MGRTAQFRRRIYRMIRAGDAQEFQENILILQNLLFRGLRWWAVRESNPRFATVCLPAFAFVDFQILNHTQTLVDRRAQG